MDGKSAPDPLTSGLSGELTPFGHRLMARVYYADTDFSGVVYHARYLEFFERGRSDFCGSPASITPNSPAAAMARRSSGSSGAWRSISTSQHAWTTC